MPALPVKIGFQEHLSLEGVVRVAYGGKVSLSPRTRSILSKRRREIVNFVNSHSEPAYGFNRGFGHNVVRAVTPNDLAELQRNLIRSHSCGVGDFAPREAVRAAMLLRAHSLSQGHSGVRPEVIEILVQFLNKDIVPCVPRYGSVGASGDLAPLSHIALALMGEGLVLNDSGSRPVRALAALAKARIKPLQLEMKEGLALNNGMQFSSALAILAHAEMQRLVKTAALATAMTAQVMLGSDVPFSAEVHRLRGHAGAQIVSAWIWKLMQNSPMREFHRNFDVDAEIQDPYNLRCAGQALGSCYDLIEQAGATLEIEANSVTDNPLIFSSRGKFTRIVSAGHFHGMPIAIALYNFLQAMGIMARLSNMRCVRYVDENRNKGLGPDLIWPLAGDSTRAASSGMMVPEYVSAALTNSIWGAAMPSHLFSLSTDAGQEDHVSMAAGLAVRTFETLPRLAEVLAIELAFATQALAIRRVSETLPTKHVLSSAQKLKISSAQRVFEKTVQGASRDSGFEAHVDLRINYRWKKSDRMLSPGCEKAAKIISKVVPPVTKDRSLSEELVQLAKVVRTDALIEAAGIGG